MNITAYKTICPYNEINLESILQILQQPIDPNGGGTSNLICPTCFNREGHPKIHCCKCGNKYIKFNNLSQTIINYQWILSATTEEEKNIRSGTIMCRFSFIFKENNKSLDWNIQTQHLLNISKSLLSQP
jgi:hypothetical protein